MLHRSVVRLAAAGLAVAGAIAAAVVTAIVATVATAIAATIVAVNPVQAAPPPEASAPAVLTLEEARRRALASAPELLLLQTEVDAARGARRTLTAWANPAVEVEVEGFGGDLDRWNDAETTWRVSQSLGNPGAWLARRRLGAAEVEAARQGLRAGRLDLLAEVERRYGGALAAAEAVRIAVEAEAIADTLVLAVESLVEAGEVSPIELDRVRVERDRAAARRAITLAAQQRAHLSLAALWGEATAGFGRLDGSLDAPLSWTSLERWRPHAPARPDQRRLQADVARARAEADLASALWIPSLETEAGLRRVHANGERSWTVALGVTVPLFDQGQGERGVARARLRASEIELRAGEARALSGRDAAWSALQGADDALRGMRDGALPSARAALEAMEEGYRRGKFGLVDLLDARRAWLETSEQTLAAGLDRWMARVELERLLGIQDPEAAVEE